MAAEEARGGSKPDGSKRGESSDGQNDHDPNRQQDWYDNHETRHRRSCGTKMQQQRVAADILNCKNV
jgi:hypothetical protein